jgi:copper(I)-binding protein
MIKVDPLSLPLGHALEMKTGGTRIRLMNLRGSLKCRQAFPAAISFERDDTVNRPTKMGKAGAMGPV